MKIKYAISHWLLTLILSPIAEIIVRFINDSNSNQVDAEFENYLTTLLISIVLSMPGFIIYLACFSYLSKGKTPVTKSKIILISVTLIVIYFTLKGLLSGGSIFAYSVIAILAGLSLKLEPIKLSTQESTFAD